MNILLCISGSVAATIADKLIATLKEKGEVKTIATETAVRFIPKGLKPMTDSDEWETWEHKGKVLHIDLKDWADVVIMAPLSANTLAKISTGLCDNLVTSVFRALPYNKRIVLAPAMNTDMWLNPITAKQIKSIKQQYINAKVAEPINKMLACGVTGMGAMAKAEDIAELIELKEQL
jgi:phosphopantothenoylcysteine decarboxylase